MADFFDRMKDGFNKGMATVSTGSKTMIEKNRINTIIRSLEDEKRQLAEIIGNKVFTYCTNNPGLDIPLAEVANICNEIHDRNQQIEEQKQRIVELDNEMTQVRGGATITASYNGVPCSCGHVNSAEAKFCAKCGATIVAKPAPGVCSCGHVNSPDGKFCAKCGNKLN